METIQPIVSSLRVSLFVLRSVASGQQIALPYKQFLTDHSRVARAKLLLVNL